MTAAAAIKDLDAEIAEERATLVRAGRNIADGQIRMRKQRDLLDRMRARRLDTREAERFAHNLGETLEQWERHHEMIVKRLTYLEGQRH